MSISVVPSATACLASAALAAVEQAPKGNEMQLVMPTPVPASRSAQCLVQHELIETVLKPCSAASSHSLSSCDLVASCLSSVWSMYWLSLMTPSFRATSPSVWCVGAVPCGSGPMWE